MAAVFVSIGGTETPHTAAHGHLQQPGEFSAVTATQRNTGLSILLQKRILGPASMELSLRRGFTIDGNTRLIDRLSAQDGRHQVWIGAL